MEITPHLLSKCLEGLSNIVVILGLPIAFIQFVRTKRKEQHDREYVTYDAIDDKYLEFQKLCLEHIDLDVWDFPEKTSKPLDKRQEKQQLIIFTMLICLFERVYLLYSDQTTNIKQRQWAGWDNFIKRYCERENFLRAWEIIGVTYDTDFESYMRATIHEVSKKSGKAV